MNVRNLLTVNAVYVALVALAAVLSPSTMLELDGGEVTPLTVNLTRLVGAASVGYGVASWLMRNARPSAARRAFLLGAGVGSVAIALIWVVNILSMGNAGTGTPYAYIVTSLLLAAAFLYFGLREPASE